ncbi:ribosomal protein S18-alanine N-acetyltransferase [Acanthopleuribacter pedis]|uniref:[Ribosomal protein bS18]-alanine N-acetyltransferase n=1 Tax=Acanthopleuribacter pedis TaxID=442870 RepID=A0A8J7U0I4_9BACT|nr:ribosomal protein S18-alanine N-acetyltransferase [Acanthopleuribacter pedis]
MTAKLTPGIDGRAFAAVEATAFDQPWRASQFQADLHYRGFAIWNGDTCLAFVYAMVVAGEAELLRIACRPEHRRRGLAANLLDALLHHCRDAAVTRMFLEVADNNHGAVAFYRRHGFADVGRRKNYYATGRDALLLARSLASENS